MVELRQTPNAYRGKHVRYWTECTCFQDALRRAGGHVNEAARLEAGRLNPHASDDDRALRAVQHLTLATFDATRLPDGPTNPYTFALRWFESISGHPIAPSYYDGPPAALYFYSPGKGRGKTHLAAGLLLRAQADGRNVAFVDEIDYIERYWAADFAAKAAMSGLPAERAWLTVLDDMGQRENRPAGLRDAWYDILNPRWMKRGWTVITSNRTPDELVEQGTINDATYSRLSQMTRKQLVTFAGTDYRLEFAK